MLRRDFQPERSYKNKTTRIISGKHVICLGTVDQSSKVLNAEIVASSKEAIVDYYFKKIKTPAVVLAICASITLIIGFVVVKDKVLVAPNAEEVPADLQCSVCLSRKKNIVLWPCKHVCLCDVCFNNKITKCPMCRVRIAHQFKIDY
jgi:hypothetical protein